MCEHASRLWISHDDHRWRSYCPRRWPTFNVHVSSIIQAAVVVRADRIHLYRFESPGTAHKKLSFSEFCGDSYERDISHKFIEYLKLCFRMYSHSTPIRSFSPAHLSSKGVSSTIHTQTKPGRWNFNHPGHRRSSLRNVSYACHSSQ